jgi:hypothetical protein
MRSKSLGLRGVALYYGSAQSVVIVVDPICIAAKGVHGWADLVVGKWRMHSTHVRPVAPSETER